MSIVENGSALPFAIEARAHVENLLAGLSPDLYYHNFSHTFNYVYPEAVRLGKAEGLDCEGLLLVSIAALFHDTGYLDQYEGNESFGAGRAKAFILCTNDTNLIKGLNFICDAILNTDMKTPPKNLVERILRDADLSAHGMPEFLDLNSRLRSEALAHPNSEIYKSAISDDAWVTLQLKFMGAHNWFTQAGRALYQPQKDANIQAFRTAHSVV